MIKNIFKLLFLSLVFVFPIFLFSGGNVKANSLYNEFSVEDQRIFSELDTILEVNEEGLPFANIEKGYELGVSEATLEVAFKINDIVYEIENEGEAVALSNIDKKLSIPNEDFMSVSAIFPIGSYGNYCGKGNNGWDVKPKDDLDTACRYHDKCFKGFTKDNRKCNKEFLDRLKPIIDKNPWHFVKGAYARAAHALFKPFT